LLPLFSVFLNYKTETAFLKTPDKTLIHSIAEIAQSPDSFLSIAVNQLPFGSFPCMM